ncbi:MAG: AarF/ABC1/UbiB kinase family protein [Polyangiaceae bacterium]|nr:AarF/ABC1/UbiB kinase family protein [Polyangiaceae bacterium]
MPALVRDFGSSPAARAKRSGVLKAMPRRPRLAHLDAGPAGLRVRRVRLPKARVHYVLWRALGWSFAIVVYLLKRAKDYVTGNRSIQRRAVRIRETFETMGGTAIKVGQQMAMRVDFLPFEVCQELGKLMDSVPPFPVEHAVKRIEAAAGAPLSEVFERFDPHPIGAASVACVFRGKLRTGEDVAVKVRRPHVEDQFVADLEIISWWTQLIEQLTMVRPDFFKNLRVELREMFLDELDFAKEANYQTIFRKYIKRDRISWLSTPRVFARLSSNDVLTTEFVRGYSCAAVLKAAETKDSEALSTLASVDIDPRVIGTRVLEIAMWSRLEVPFFHADPHPGNIIVFPNNRIALLDFGACGITSAKQAAHQIEMSRRLSHDDIAGAAAVSLSMLTPLPSIDTAELKKRLEKAIWDYHIVSKSKDAEWWERTTAAIWVGMIEVTKDFNLPVNLDILRMTRATLLYDTLACRLNPNINSDNAYRRWRKQAIKRARKRTQKRMSRIQRSGRAAVLQEIGAIQETMRKGSFWVSNMTRELPKEFIAATGKGAFVFATLLRFLFSITLVAIIAVAAVLIRVGGPAGQSASGELAKQALTHPAVVVLTALLTISVIRRIQKRLSETDPDR